MNSRAKTHPPGRLIPKCAYYLIGSLALLLICAAADAGASVDARDYPGSAWSPYLVGAAIGVLSWLTFYFSDEAIGVSSFYAHLAGFLGKLIAPRHTKSLAYFKDSPPCVGWEFVFVVTVIVGGAIAAFTSGEFANEWLPPMWIARFGDSITLRAVVAFGGGILMAFGARLAGGCTSGHGISGTLQLNVASWIAVICFFIGGTAVAMLLFKI
ncbi:MAG: YeeE/YedE thiosulfate transporter family protein [Geobacteraceae bacterium]